MEKQQTQAWVVFQIDSQTLAAAGVLVAAASDPGRVREQNEDFLGLYTPPPGISQDMGVLAVLADGMGGHAAGEVASELAVATIASMFYQADLACDESIPDNDFTETACRLYAGFLEADHAIRRAGQHSHQQEGMGCTCIAAVQTGDEITLAHVGDTRDYLIQADSSDPIRQLTADHSFVAELVRAGVLAEEEAQYSPRRHMVTRALGGQLDMTACLPDMQAFRLRAGDILLLCCDGLWNMVAPEQIVAAVQETPLEHACTTLIEQAREAGGEDNISVILLAVRAGK